MAQFDRQINTALRLIAKNGESVIWRQISEGTNADQPWNPPPTEVVDHEVSICFLPVSKEGYETFSVRAGTELPKGAVMGLMGDNGFSPNLRDIVIRDGVQMAISYIDTLSPNGQKIIHKVLLIA